MRGMSLLASCAKRCGRVNPSLHTLSLNDVHATQPPWFPQGQEHSASKGRRYAAGPRYDTPDLQSCRIHGLGKHTCPRRVTFFSLQKKRKGSRRQQERLCGRTGSVTYFKHQRFWLMRLIGREMMMVALIRSRRLSTTV